MGKIHETLFNLANFITIMSSTASILSSIFDLYHKRERSWLDYFQLSMSIFMFTNVFTKPLTLKSFFESEQMKHLGQIKESLKVKALI